MTVRELRSLLAEVEDEALVLIPDFSTSVRDGEYTPTTVMYREKPMRPTVVIE